MELLPAGQSNSMAGTTEVTVVPAASNALIKRTVRSIRIHNRDTASVEITLRKKVGASNYVIDKATKGAGETYSFGASGEILVLSGTNESVTALLTAAPAANQPDVTASWEDGV